MPGYRQVVEGTFSDCCGEYSTKTHTVSIQQYSTSGTPYNKL